MAEGPRVVAIMVTSGRACGTRAVECFRRQTYANRRLLIWDTGPRRPVVQEEGILHPFPASGPLGQLRNNANASVEPFADILVHWDDDDWSHQRRIEEQVALLLASGKQAVGYNQMWFHDQRQPEGAAWLYSMPDPRYCLGTSLCYWVSAWKARPFPAVARYEDDQWLPYLTRTAVSAGRVIADTRMIATIHGQNTSAAYRMEEMVGNPEWTLESGKNEAALREILEA